MAKNERTAIAPHKPRQIYRRFIDSVSALQTWQPSRRRDAGQKSNRPFRMHTRAMEVFQREVRRRPDGKEQTAEKEVECFSLSRGHGELFVHVGLPPNG